MKPFIWLHIWSPNEIEKLTKPGATQHRTLQDMREKYPGATFVCELSKGRKFCYQGKQFVVSNMGKGKNIYALEVSGSTKGPWTFGRHTRVDLEA